MIPSPPGDLGQRLLPRVMDEIAASDPSRVFFSILKGKDPAEGFLDVTAERFVRAVDNCAWYIEEQIGRAAPGEFPTLLYMGPQDLNYGVVIMASIKAGYKALLSSTRNTLAAHLFLMEQTDCDAFLLPRNFALPVVGEILGARQLQVVDLPDIHYWLDSSSSSSSSSKTYRPYPYTKTWAEARLDPWVVLHTSGSTGLPKPIIQTHATMAHTDSHNALPSLGYPATFPCLATGWRVYLAFPLFHGAGAVFLLPALIFSNYTAVLGPFPPSAESVSAVHLHGDVQASCLPPSILVELAREKRYLEALGRLKVVTFGGGPLPKPAGDAVIAHTRLFNALGTTEAGILPAQLNEPEDWQYLNISPVAGCEYRHVSDDLYEQVIVRRDELERYQGVFGTFPGLTEWPLKDLYSKHPTKEGLWLYRGRSDDIIVLSNGEKLNPSDVESMIESSPVVAGALVAGTGRFQTSLLVETAEGYAEAGRDELIDAVWPLVRNANEVAPSHGRIHRHMILFTSPGKPMLRTPKGTVMRKGTLKLYEPEIDALYHPNGDADANDRSGSHSSSISDAVAQIVAKSTGLSAARLAEETDLFGLGMDSLQVTLITRELNSFLSSRRSDSPRAAAAAVEPRTIYSNPSIGGIVSAVTALLQGDGASKTAVDDVQKMESLFRSAATTVCTRPAQPKPAGDSVVLLTGSTGSLGSYILDALLSQPQVSQIVCLNRGPDSLKRQQSSLAAKGLQPLSAKVKCLDADLARPFFGLPLEEYKPLLRSVTTVIHNAWQVDFNLSLDSFAPHITAVTHMAQFSAASTFGAQIFFISSIGTITNYHDERSSAQQPVAAPALVVPERIISDWATPQPMGYAQAKFVAERVLDAAARDAGVPAVVCRVGQIAGPVVQQQQQQQQQQDGGKGVWPRREWLPSLVASSKHLGRIPADLGRMEDVDWIPVDLLGRCLVELALAAAGRGGQGREDAAAAGAATVYHTVNPRRTQWKALLPTVRAHLGGGTEIVPLGEWVPALRRSAADLETAGLEANPAAKILGFWEGLVRKDGGGRMPRLDTKETVKASPTLAALEPVQTAWMETWLKQWAL